MKKIVLIIAAALICTSLFSQDKDRITKKEMKAKKKLAIEKEIQEIIDSKNFTFIARQANPMSGSSINLTSEYDLKIKNDSAYAYLPFYGVAYRAEYGSTEGGIKFEEPTKDYRAEIKKNNHVIKFLVKVPQDQYDIVLNISKTGYGTLKVNSNNRQSISFYGIIEGLGL